MIPIAHTIFPVSSWARWWLISPCTGVAVRSQCEQQPLAVGPTSISYSWFLISAMALYLILALCLFAS